MWLVQSVGKPRSRLLAEGWTEEQIVRAAASHVLYLERKKEAEELAKGI